MMEFVLHHSQLLPSELKLPFSWSMPQSEKINRGELSFDQGHLSAFDGERWQHFDLQNILNSFRPAPKGFASEPLARALGLLKKPAPKRVIDASCGTGKDALQVWKWGHEILAFERNPLVYVLLWDALRRHPIPKFELRFGDASDHQFTSNEYIMFDPMFAETEKKKSLPRKEMQLFKNVVGPDLDQDEVMQKLLKSGAGRIVVKRPVRLNPNLNPNHSFTGKTTRFDVYLGATS